MKLQTKIFLGLVAGILVGGVSRIPNAVWLQRAVIFVQPLGIVFIRLITMVVVPLVVASLFVGIASLGDVRRLGRVGGKTLAYFLGTTVIAATIGMALAMAVGLGQGIGGHLRDLTTLDFGPGGPLQTAADTPRLVQLLVGMIPQNPFASAASGDLLPLIIAVCIFAAAATVTQGSGKNAVLTFFEGVNAIAMVVIRWLMALAPAAVFVLIAGTVATSGVHMLELLVMYACVVVVAMAIHTASTLMLALRLGARLGVREFFRAVSDALLLAFSTASSSATLPVSMAAARTRLGISNEVVSFVLPAGTTMDKNGAATYKAVTAVFLAHLYGLPIGPELALVIVLTSTAAAFAGAGVPGSSLVTTMIVLNAIGLGPNAAAGIALVTAIDRPLDMCRTTVNTIGNLVGAAWVARSEGEALQAVTILPA